MRGIRPRGKPGRGGQRASAASEGSAGGAPTAVRIHETVGSSTRSWDAAVTDAVRSAKDDAPGPVAVEVGRLWADLDPSRRIRLYRAAVRIAYRQRIIAPPRETSARTTARKRARRA